MRNRGRRNTAEDAAAAIGFRDDPPVFHGEGVVVFASTQARGGKTRAKFHALDGGNAEYVCGDAAFQTVAQCAAKPRRRTLNHTFHHAADAVAVVLRVQNGAFH